MNIPVNSYADHFQLCNLKIKIQQYYVERQMKIDKLSVFVSVICLLFTIQFSVFPQEQHKKEKTHWSYSGKEGPEHWSELNPEYSPCNNGYSQSPINISRTYLTKLKPLSLNYKSAGIDLINNGHTIEERIKPGSNAIIDGQKYNLLQFHFHTPSEHTVNGKHYPMELHLVHENNSGQIAVVGIFFKKGKPNSTLQKLINNLPEGINKPVVNKNIKIDIEKLLPSERSYFHYFGSLTTPACKEGVSWNIFTTPVEASQKQIEIFHKIMGNNARPVQPLHNRFILQSE